MSKLTETYHKKEVVKLYKEILLREPEKTGL
jgi:hypothetical protein